MKTQMLHSGYINFQDDCFVIGVGLKRLTSPTGISENNNNMYLYENVSISFPRNKFSSFRYINIVLIFTIFNLIR